MSSSSDPGTPSSYQPYGGYRPDGGYPTAPAEQVESYGGQVATPQTYGYPGPQLHGYPAAPPPYGYPQRSAEPSVWPAPPPLVRPIGTMPERPVPYQQMLRGPRHRWWKPLLTLLLAAAIAFPLMLVAVVPVVLFGAASGVEDLGTWTMDELTDLEDLGPGGFLYVNLSLIALIPAAMFSIWAVHGVRPRFLTSVAGGMRWRWLARCVLVVLPLWAGYLGLSALVETPQSPRPAEWLLLLVVVVIFTPLQAAAEEYLFRGWIMQNFGAWFRHPMVGLVITTAAAAALFAAAHGSPDIWVLASLALFSVTASLATWYTGGLEAGIAIHAINNVGVFVLVITAGGWQEAFVGADTESTPAVFVVALVVHALALALIIWQARRAKIDRCYRPTAPPALASTYPAPVPAAGWAPNNSYSSPGWPPTTSR